MTPDRDELRRLARDEECPVPLPQVTPPVDPSRPEEPCAVPAETTPDEFFAPVPPVEEPLDLATVGPVLCGPAGMTVACSDLSDDPDYTGNSVTLGSDDLDKRPFFWQDIPQITENQIRYISTLSEEDRNRIANVTFSISGIVTSWELSTAEVAELYQLRPSQATFARSLVNSMSAASWHINHQRALSRLSCAFRNDEQTANCAAGAVTSFQGQTYVNTYTIAADLVESQISKADANAIALVLAQSELDCLWLNDQITRRCSQQTGLNGTQISNYQTLETAGPLTVVFLPGRPEEVTRILESVISAGTIPSTTSKSAANALATTEADLGLNCFFTAAAAVDCPLDVDNVPSDSPPSDVFSGIPGKAVSVPAGLVTTIVSQAAAAADALSFANSLLLCYWLNERQEVLCADAFGGVTVPGPDGEPITVTISDRSSTFTNSEDVLTYGAVVEAGEVQSDTSRADANAQAEVIGLSRTVCIYCNGLVPPFCMPTPLWEDIDPEERPPLPLIPTDYESDAENGPQWWSADATLGVPAGRFCVENDPPGAQALANATGSLPFQTVEIGEDCIYLNDPAAYSCTDALGEGNPDAPYLSPRSSAPVSIAGGLTFARLSTTPVDWMVGEPDHQRVKGYANELARLTALTILDCFFESPNLAIYCGAEVGATLPAAANWTNVSATPSPIGDGRAGVDNEYVSRLATGFLTDAQPDPVPRPVMLPFGAGRSNVSPREALDFAIVEGIGSLDCFFKESGTATCLGKPDTRVRHIDNRINGTPSIPYDGADGTPGSFSPGFGSPYNDTNDTGQSARFLFSGVQATGALTVFTNPPGQTPPSATDTAISYVSKTDATQQAVSSARGRLDCTHTNWYRDNDRCPPNHYLALQGEVDRDEITSDSTETANLQAEELAVSLTRCVPRGPFNVGVAAAAGGGVEWRMNPGGATYYGSNLACGEDLKPGEILKKLYWNDCSTPVGEDWRPLDDGKYLFWIDARCCSGELRLILTITDDDESDGEMADFDFYPTTQLEALQAANPTRIYFYVAAVHSQPEPGARAGISVQSAFEVYQHLDSGINILPVPGDQRFKPVFNEDGTLGILPGVVVCYDNFSGLKIPHYPKLGATRLDASTPPSVSLGSGARKIWIKIDEADSEIFNKAASDTDFDDEGKMWILLATFTVTSGEASDVKHIWRSDIIVGQDTNIESSGTSDPSSEDPDGSSASSAPGSDPSSASDPSSDPHEDCEGEPFTAVSEEFPTCRYKRPPGVPDSWQMVLSWDANVNDICEHCPTWFARLTVNSPAVTFESFDGTGTGEHAGGGQQVHWIFEKDFTGETVCACTGTARFKNNPFTPCVPVVVTMEVYGTPPVDDPNPCCGFWPPDVFNLGLTPYYCEDGGCPTTGP